MYEFVHVCESVSGKMMISKMICYKIKWWFFKKLPYYIQITLLFLSYFGG